MSENGAAHGSRSMRILRRLPGVVSAMLAASVLIGAVQWIGGPVRRGMSIAADVGEKLQMHLTNQVGHALAGLSQEDRVYWIGRREPVAPVPDPDAYAEATPEELKNLPQAAKKLLGGQKLYFSPDIQVSSGTMVQYYLDETILAITWKQLLDGGMYTFSEVKIAHPSQFRRFLAGGEFGSDKLYITTEMAQTVNAVVASSGDFYGYRRAGTLVYDGEVRRVHNGLVDTCYINKNGDLLFSDRGDDRSQEESQQFVDENDILFSLAFGPVLIRDGTVVTPDSYAVGEINDHYPRSALCQLGPLHYLLAVVNQEGEGQRVPTIHRFAENLLDSGIHTAYALDGGQTAVIAMDGKLINAVLFGYQRRISDIVYFATAIPNTGKPGPRDQE